MDSMLDTSDADLLRSQVYFKAGETVYIYGKSYKVLKDIVGSEWKELVILSDKSPRFLTYFQPA